MASDPLAEALSVVVGLLEAYLDVLFGVFRGSVDVLRRLLFGGGSVPDITEPVVRSLETGFIADWWPALSLLVLGAILRTYLDWQDAQTHPFNERWNPAFLRPFLVIRRGLIRLAKREPSVSSLSNAIRIVATLVLFPIRRTVAGAVNLGGRVRRLTSGAPSWVGLLLYLGGAAAVWLSVMSSDISGVIEGLMRLDPLTWAIVAAVAFSSFGWLDADPEAVANSVWQGPTSLGALTPVWTFILVFVAVYVVERFVLWLDFRRKSYDDDPAGFFKYVLGDWKLWLKNRRR